MAALTKQREFEIRLRFERGEDLKALAVIYKVPLSTLNKRKKRSAVKGDPWIKGSQSKKSFKRFMEKDEEDRAQMREAVSKKARREMKVLESMIDEAYADGSSFKKETEEVVLRRSYRISQILRLRKEIEDIPSLKDEAELEKAKLDIRLKKLEVEAKEIDNKFKKAEAVEFLEGENDDQ